MTPENFAKIALWMGWEKERMDGLWWWIDPKRTVRCAVIDKTSLTPTEAVEALELAIAKGYSVGLDGDEMLVDEPPHKGWVCDIDGYNVFAPTIALAVETALLQMLEKEESKTNGN